MAQNAVDHFAGRKLRSITGAALSGLGSARPAHISRRGNRFTLVDALGNQTPMTLMDDKGNPYIDVIIVDVNEHSSRVYYGEGYDENNAGPPTCFSDNGTGPSVNSTVPQSSTCAACPQAAWGSAISKLTGQPIPACQSSKKLAVLVAGHLDSTIYEFVIPPGSWSDKLRGWRWYASMVQKFVIGNRPAEFYDVVTRINFARDKMGILEFNAAGLTDAAQAGAVVEALESGDTDAVVGRTDRARDPALPIGTKPQAIQAPRPAPAPPQAPPAPQGLQFIQPPAQPAPATKKPGRPPKAAAPQIQAQPEALDMPPFLQRPQPAATQAAPSPTTPSGFGMAAPQEMDSSLKQALLDALKLDT